MEETSTTCTALLFPVRTKIGISYSGPNEYTEKAILRNASSTHCVPDIRFTNVSGRPLQECMRNTFAYEISGRIGARRLRRSAVQAVEVN